LTGLTRDWLTADRRSGTGRLGQGLRRFFLGLLVVGLLGLSGLIVLCRLIFIVTLTKDDDRSDANDRDGPTDDASDQDRVALGRWWRCIDHGGRIGWRLIGGGDRFGDWFRLGLRLRCRSHRQLVDELTQKVIKGIRFFVGLVHGRMSFRETGRAPAGAPEGEARIRWRWLQRPPR
jgi:hypothetical protein